MGITWIPQCMQYLQETRGEFLDLLVLELLVFVNYCVGAEN